MKKISRQYLQAGLEALVIATRQEIEYWAQEMFSAEDAGDFPARDHANRKQSAAIALLIKLLRLLK